MLHTERVNHMLRSIGSGSGEFAVGHGRAVRDHPLPAVLTGVGLTWLALSGGQPRREYEPRRHWPPDEEASAPIGTDAPRAADTLYREPQPVREDPNRGPTILSEGYGPDVRSTPGNGAEENAAGEEVGRRRTAERLKETTSAVGGRTREAAGRAGERLHRTRERVNERLGRASAAASGGVHKASSGVEEVASTVGSASNRVYDRSAAAYHGSRHAAEQAISRVGDTTRSAGGFIQENPLIAGALAFAAGALVAMAFASSRREQEFLGEASAEVKSQMRATVEEQVERAKSVAGTAAEAAMDAARKQTAASDREVKAEDARTANATPPSPSPDVAVQAAAASAMPGAGPGVDRIRTVKTSPLFTDPEAPGPDIPRVASSEDELRRR